MSKTAPATPRTLYGPDDNEPTVPNILPTWRPGAGPFSPRCFAAGTRHVLPPADEHGAEIVVEVAP